MVVNVLRRAGALVTAPVLGLWLASASANAGITAVDGPVPVTGDSVIYNAANVAGSPFSIDLEQFSYVEEEYFISGTADAYKRKGDGDLAVLSEAIPYTTRIVVRRPQDWAKFSGVVHFEAMHPSQGGTSHWLATDSYIVEQGDAYVMAGLGDDKLQRRISAEGEYPTAQSRMPGWFDPERYAPLSWPEEDGIRYDVMADVVELLRSKRDSNPFRQQLPDTVLAAGWSFTGSLLRTFINEGFHERRRLPDGSPLIDGYLVGISSRWNGGGHLALSSVTPSPAVDDPVRDWTAIDVPVIEFLTEFEVVAGSGPQAPDSDDPRGGHRLYELGGAVHGEQLVDKPGTRLERPHLVQLAAKGYPARETHGPDPMANCPLPASDVPLGPLARAALDNLKRWVATGEAPPHASQLELDASGKPVRDRYGNPKGGIRIAEFEVPVARYGVYPGSDRPGCASEEGRPLYFKMNLETDVLHDLYGSEAAYLKQYDAAVDRLVAQRWLLPADGAKLKAQERGHARAVFGEE